MAQKLQFKAAETSGEVLVTGSLNRNSVPQGWSNRRSWLPKTEQVVLDLAGVEQVDSAGLAMLIRLQAELQNSNQRLSLRNINKQLEQFAEVSGVTGLLSLS